MSARLLGLLAASALALAGCRDEQPSLPSDFRGPTAVVPVASFAHFKPGELRDYLAVASSRGNEIRLFDPSDDKSVTGPIVLSFPLSIITRPNPTMLASARLYDFMPDVLVAVSSGTAALQLISTWEDAIANRAAGNRVVREIDLSQFLAAGDEILSVVGTPVPGAIDPVTNEAVAQTGRARILVAASGGKLISIDFVRGPDQSVVEQAPVLQTVGFDIVDMAVSPSNYHVYAATSDLITGVNGSGFGVAELDLSSAVAPPWTIRWIDALAPTRVVAAAKVAERLRTDTDQFEPTPKLRVYAALDVAGCGFDKPISCGIATLDPATAKLETDPSGQLPYRAPMTLPSLAQDIKIALPPAAGRERQIANEAAQLPGMWIAPGAGRRITTAVGAVSATDGKVYLIDLGRWQIPTETSLLRGPTRFAVTTIELINGDNQVTTEPTQVLGLRWVTVPTDKTDDVITDPAAMFERFVITPGFTPSDDWRVTYQGQLISGREARFGKLTSGEGYVAFQQPAGRTDASGNPTWSNTITVADPVLGLRVGDIVQLPGVEGCGTDPTSTPEVTVASLAAPDPILFPGGALVLSAIPPCVEARLTASGKSTLNVTPIVRAAGFLLAGASIGYAGRPDLDQPFLFQWADESTLSGEALALARKARRFYYPYDPPCLNQLETDTPESCKPLVPDPLAPGPAIGFKLALPPGNTLRRDMSIHFITQSGVSLTARFPSSGGTLPTGITVVDPTKFVGRENFGMRFYVTYSGDDAMIAFDPGGSLADTRIFRSVR